MIQTIKEINPWQDDLCTITDIVFWETVISVISRLFFFAPHHSTAQHTTPHDTTSQHITFIVSEPHFFFLPAQMQAHFIPSGMRLLQAY